MDVIGQTVSNGNFAAGEYCLTIRDAGGCVIAGTCVRLEGATPIAVDLTVGDACGLSAGTLDIRVNTGVGPLTFGFDDGRETTELRVGNIAAGVQTLVITDANGCIAVGGFKIGQCPPCNVFGNASTTQRLQVSCGNSATLCLPNAQSRIGGLQIFDNGVRYTGSLNACASDASGIGLSLAAGPHLIIVYDSIAQCADSLRANVVCAPVDTQQVVVVIDSTQRFCLSMADLLGGTVVSVTNICPDSSKARYEIVSDTCVIARGDTLGTQIGCWVVCADNGLCDTTVVIVQVIPDSSVRIFRDTVQVGSGGALCLTTAEVGLPGSVLTITNTCVDSSGTRVDFAVDGAAACIDYDGLAVGEESACLTLCDELGNCILGQLIVTVIPRDLLSNKLIVYDTVFVNQTKQYCPDPSLGTFTWEERGYVNLEAGLDSSQFCLRYRGLSLGNDTLDLRAVSLSDTTPICVIVSVIPYTGGVAAVDDATCTLRNRPVRLNVLANDEAFGGIASFDVQQPDAVLGSVSVNADNTITFTPAADVCAQDATFTYRVCNGNTGAADGGCAEATVTICIECEELTIFTALTPNGDGKNETFYVAKIEDFPNNQLQIFNRWGNLVYEKRGYLNEWRGTYNGDPLPDGAYFYILDVTDGDKTTSYNGYIEIIQ